MQQPANKTSDARFWACFADSAERLALNFDESDLPPDWWQSSLLKRAEHLLAGVSEVRPAHPIDEQKVTLIAGGALLACGEKPIGFRETFERRVLAMQTLVEQKGEDYNAGGVSILEYWPQGAANIIHEIRKRALRLVSLARSGQHPRYDEIEDIALDIAAYSVFLLAYTRTQGSTPKLG